jgi:hypothetical protein
MALCRESRLDIEGKLKYWGIELDPAFTLPKEFKVERSRIMYLENKSRSLEGEARIGRVYFSKSGKTLYYRGLRFQSLKGSGFKSNYYEVESLEEYWISGPRKDENNRLYGGNRGVVIDEDIKEEYAKLVGNA